MLIKPTTYRIYTLKIELFWNCIGVRKDKMQLCQKSPETIKIVFYHTILQYLWETIPWVFYLVNILPSNLYIGAG
jgi:hypothetical protein